MSTNLAERAHLAYVTVGTYDGQALVIPGHSHTAADLTALAETEFPNLAPQWEEVHWWAQKRVTWCGRYGDACDCEGEPHTHWHGVKPTDDPACQFTVVWGERRTTPTPAADESGAGA